MKIIFAGNNLRSYKCLNYLVKKKVVPFLIIAHKKNDKTKYFKNLRFLAKKLKIKCISPSNMNSNVSKNIIKKNKPDLMIMCGYSQNILKKNIFQIPKFGTWNLHASDLPKYRGAAPLNWAIINNENKIGISIIQLDSTIDGGDIICKKILKLKKNETIGSLTEKVNDLYPKILFNEIIKLKNGKLKKIKQNEKKATYFTKRYPEDSYLNFNIMNADKIQRVINASAFPYTSAFFFYKKKKLSVNPKTQIIKNSFGIPGRIIKKDKNSITIVCKKNAIKIHEIIYKNQLINPIRFKIKVGTNVNI